MILRKENLNKWLLENICILDGHEKECIAGCKYDNTGGIICRNRRIIRGRKDNSSGIRLSGGQRQRIGIAYRLTTIEECDVIWYVE